MLLNRQSKDSNMNLYDIVTPMTMDEAKATKQRLDPKCWKGKHKEGTKVKGGVRVNNCVANESSNDFIDNDSTSPVGGNTQNEDNFHASQDSWHAGDNAWSSDQHEMFEGHSFSNGDQVELKPEYADRAGEVYTVSQCDTERGRCWIGDADGRGWYANFNQLIPAVDQEVEEHIVKVAGGYELKSKHGNKNLGKYPTKGGAEKRERQVQYFKHAGESAAEAVNPALANLTPDEIKGIGMMIQNGHDIPTIIRIFDNKPTAEQITAIATANMQQGVAEMDKSQTPPGRAGDYPLGVKGTTGKPVTAKQVVKDLTKDLDQAFSKEKKVKEAGSPAQQDAIAIAKKKEQGVEEGDLMRSAWEKTQQAKSPPPKPTPVKESYWTRLQNERNTKLNTLVNELKESIKK